ncbi:MAG: hypothetical protein JWQ38_257 [Flavipsychrobacter sp.]|nr:hypothetical protein [Flavipsychrobacter sp.]
MMGRVTEHRLYYGINNLWLFVARLWSMPNYEKQNNTDGPAAFDGSYHFLLL